jgi:hypothetical protein
MRRLILLLAAAAALSAAETYRVAGVIVDSQTGSPMANAALTLSPMDRPHEGILATSGTDGSFAFDAALGKYNLMAVIAGISQPFGQVDRFIGMGTSIITGPDQDTAHLVFRWHRLAAITGRVLDDQGEPVENAQVRFFCSAVFAGRKRIAPTAGGSTNDQGYYRAWAVMAGAYYAFVTAKPWWNWQRVGAEGSQAASIYPTVYYPGTTDITRAALLTVQPGEEARVDFTLTATTAAKLTVNCDNCEPDAPSPARSRSLMELRVTAQGLGGTETETAVAQRNAYRWPVTLDMVPPGHYLVRLSGTDNENALTAERWIDVGAGDITVSLSLHQAAAVSGRLTIKANVAPPARPLTVRLIPELNGEMSSAAIEADGSFRLLRVHPGKYRVAVSGGGYYAETVSSGDAALTGGLLNIEDGAESRLNIVANHESGRVKGYATRDDQPVANMLVVLVPRDPASGYVNQPFQTDSDGSFDLGPLGVGDYLLFAVDDPTIAWADPETVKPYLAQAKQIHIELGKVLEERVPVQPAVK